MKKENIALLIVAAGASNRLGQPKQLVKKGRLTLLENTLNIAKESKAGQVFLVLGANADLILDEIEVADCQVFINRNWQEGMGESIAFGVRELTKFADYSSVIISVGDQPFLSFDVFKNIAEQNKNEQSIIRSKYAEGSGPPVYFAHIYFEELKQLTGDDGAKPILKKYKSRVKEVNFTQGNIDIDKKEDLQHWK